jgi:hypothetical protein
MSLTEQVGVTADDGTILVDTATKALAGSSLAVSGAISGALGVAAQQFTATAALTSGVRMILLNHATVIIAVSIAAAELVVGQIWVIIDNSASGTAAHTVTLVGGATWDGTNDVATLNAPDELLVVIVESATRLRVLINTGSVAFS